MNLQVDTSVSETGGDSMFLHNVGVCNYNQMSVKSYSICYYSFQSKCIELGALQQLCHGTLYDPALLLPKNIKIKDPDAQFISVRKPKGTRPLGRHMFDGRTVLKIDVKGTGCDGAD
jgi:hypothetical protein